LTKAIAKRNIKFIQNLHEVLSNFADDKESKVNVLAKQLRN